MGSFKIIDEVVLGLRDNQPFVLYKNNGHCEKKVAKVLSSVDVTDSLFQVGADVDAKIWKAIKDSSQKYGHDYLLFVLLQNERGHNKATPLVLEVSQVDSRCIPSNYKLKYEK